MKQKKGLIVTALVLFAINWIATTISGYSSVLTMMGHVSIMSLHFLWTVFNAFVGMVVAILLVVAAICALKNKGSLLAASAFLLCAVQNFLSFVPNWPTVMVAIRFPVQLLRIIGYDWLCAAAYLAIAIVALLKWRGKIAGVIGAAVVLSVRMFAICRTMYYILQTAAPMGQMLPSLLANFLFCILCLNVGILLYVLAQKRKEKE